MSLYNNTQEQFLRSKYYDNFLIFGTLLIGVLASQIVLIDNSLFALILTLDLWLLGYHHVISTYSRFLESNTWSEHKSLITYLPIIVICSVFLLTKHFGLWLIATIYLYWQFFHYLRQSEGISKAIARKGKCKLDKYYKLDRLTFYIIPIVSFLNLSFQKPTEFLWMPLKFMSIPEPALYILNAIAIILLSIFLIRSIFRMKSGYITKNMFFFSCTHFIIFIFSYTYVQNINYGWLAINIWHNLQYILFVWLFNTNKYFKGEVKSPILQFLYSPKRMFQYLTIFFIITTLFYGVIDKSIVYLQPFTSVPLVIVIYQTINFHHYIVDSLIWKLRKSSISNNILT